MSDLELCIELDGYDLENVGIIIKVLRRGTEGAGEVRAEVAEIAGHMNLPLQDAAKFIGALSDAKEGVVVTTPELLRREEKQARNVASRFTADKKAPVATEEK